MASRSVNKVILLGHLGKDAETRYTPQGTPVSNFSLATNRRWKDQQTGEWKEETDWHNIVLWKGENLAPHLQKGKQVYLEGRLQTRSWEDKKDGSKRYATEVVCDASGVVLLGGRGGAEAAAAGAEEPAPGVVSMPRANRAAAPAPAPAEAASQEISDEDVPF
jgi:single-strand DNA-binding protein